MKSFSNHFLSAAMLAWDENVVIGWPHAGYELQNRVHGRCLRDKGWPSIGAEKLIFRLQPPLFPKASAKFDLSPQDGQKPRVFPRLLDEIPRPAAHRFDSQFDAPPCRHDNYRQSRIHRLYS